MQTQGKGDFDRPSRSPSKDFFDRLHADNLKRLKNSEERK